MIFSIVIILGVGIIAYYHYVQGFFSATISCVIAILSAMLAVSLHEPMVTTLLRGKLADSANALCLISLFALFYLIGRTIFDAAVPGNVRVPAAVDAVGGGLMGFIAGIFAMGIMAIAAQTLGFGPSVAGYSRYALSPERDVQVPGERQQVDAVVTDELTEQTMDPTKASGMLLPVDDIVVNMVNRLSDGGSLAGTQKFKSIHPDLLTELFGQRIGVQVGAQRTALNIPGATAQVTLGKPGVFRLEKMNQFDAEIGNVRGKPITVPEPRTSEMLLVVRILFNNAAADKDGLARVSPGAVRLVANATNYFPIGTLEEGRTVFVNKPDDTLFITVKDADRGADFVFVVPAADVAVGEGKEAKVADGVFVEVKRLARLELSGESIVSPVKASKDVQVLRKPKVMEARATPQAKAGATVAPPADSPFVFSSVSVSNKLFTQLNTGTPDKDANNIAVDWGQASLKGGKFSKLLVNTTRTLRQMSVGSNLVGDLFEPAGKKIVQIVGSPPEGEGGDPWAWGSNLREFTLLDAAGAKLPINGGFAKVTAKGAERMAGAFNAESPVTEVAQEEGRPTDVYLIFVVPSGANIKQLLYKGQPLTAIDQVVQ
jgi:hypothetical protein